MEHAQTLGNGAFAKHQIPTAMYDCVACSLPKCTLELEQLECGPTYRDVAIHKLSTQLAGAI